MTKKQPTRIKYNNTAKSEAHKKDLNITVLPTLLCLKCSLYSKGLYIRLRSQVKNIGRYS